MSLYLKYRPQDFANVVSQSHVVKTLENTLKQNQLAHAYLFCGPRGTGKTSMARIVAKSLNCTNRQPDSAEPCHNCQICSDINQGRLVDLIEIDAASNRGIDEIRELREKIVFTPTQAKAKVYIIDEVHMLTKEAFNALLKTLEEPPEHAYFILATTEAHKIPETIVSRCQQFTFKRIENTDIVGRLSYISKQEGIEADENALFLIAKAAHGGMRDAIGLLEQMAASGPVTYEATSVQLGVSGHVVMEKIEDALMNQDPAKAIQLLGQIHAQGKSLNAFLEEWVNHLREQMLSNLDDQVGVNQYIQWIELFTTARQQLSQAIIPQLPIEIAIVRACDFEVREEFKRSEIESTKIDQTSPKSAQKEEMVNEEAKTDQPSPLLTQEGNPNFRPELKAEKKEVVVEEVEVKEVKIEMGKGDENTVRNENFPSLQQDASESNEALKAEEIPVEAQATPAPTLLQQSENVPVESTGASVEPEVQQASAEEVSQPEDVEESGNALVDFDLATIQQKWAELLGAVEVPFVKMSLMDGKPVKLEKNNLYLEFNSSTLMQKIELASNQAIVMKAFEQTFRVKPTLKLSVRKITLSPEPIKEKEEKVEVKEVKSSETPDSVVDMAQEVFGIK